ncbi:MAG: hypothetical protein Q9P01_00950 [Anaerolineae bacterium]|nr:hypothetical protein [Anaerolineae bacterium]MDQ7033435.1 hypothetical protein [Anaerolineae bacterium]
MVRIEVVDTNVWASVDKIPPKDQIEADCIKACIEWFQAFRQGEDEYKIAVDMAFKILTEYHGQIKKGGLAERYLNDILSQPMTRIVFTEVEYDENGHAILLDNIMDDPSDRKFIAVALHFEPPALIINATDTDWEKSRDKLEDANITIQELCPDYIAAKIK